MNYILLLGLLATGATTTPLLTTCASAKTCKTYDSIRLEVTSTNQIFSLPKFANNYYLTDFTTNLAARLSNETFFPFSSPKKNQTQTATYTLSGTFCTPSTAGTKSKTILLLTHGLNFNRNYWDSDYQPERYSFVDAAIAEGYSVFYYDRLGVGKSQKVSGYLNQNAIQTALGVAITKAVKAGKYTGSIGKPEKLVLVGHSYGSGISAQIASAEPELVDGLILTGWSFAGGSDYGFVQASQFRIASGEKPFTWGKLDTGYVTPVDIYANVNAFFKKPNFTYKVAEYAESIKEPIAISEVLTATDLEITRLKEFTGAALVIAGQFDFVFCASRCDDVIDTGAKWHLFDGAKAYKAVSYPGAGHGLNFALNAPGAFKIILDFINTNV